MKYSQDNGLYVIALERGEELVETLWNFCKKKGFEGGSFLGIGASDDLELGYRNLETKEYVTKRFNDGIFEIANLVGNISEEKLHIHVTIGDSEFNTYAGHLVSAVVNPTMEIYLRPFDGVVRRKLDDVSGLEVLDLEEEG